MSKSRSHKPEEDLRGLLRQLRSENAQLKRELRSARQRFIQKIEEIEEEQEEKVIHCPSCKLGRLEIFEVVGRSFVRCSDCFYRERLV